MLRWCMLLFSIADYSHPLVGGMIRLSAVMLWWGIAKIAGISGIVASLWQPNSPDFAWQWRFCGLASIALAGWSCYLVCQPSRYHHRLGCMSSQGYWSVWARGWAQGVPVVMRYLWQCALFARSLVLNHCLYVCRVCDGVYRSSFVVIDLIETLGAYIMRKNCVINQCYQWVWCLARVWLSVI